MWSSFVLCSLEKISSSSRCRVRRVSRAVVISSAFSWSAMCRRARVAFWASDKEGRERTRVSCWACVGLRPAWVEGSSTWVITSGNGEGEAMRAMALTVEWAWALSVYAQRSTRVWSRCWLEINYQHSSTIASLRPYPVTPLSSTHCALCTVSYFLLFSAFIFHFFKWQRRQNRLQHHNHRLPEGLAHPIPSKMVSGSFLVALFWPFTTEHETCVETSEEDEVALQCQPTPPTTGRYMKQAKSAQGKVAYVVYAGNDLGVFYNW